MFEAKTIISKRYSKLILFNILISLYIITSCTTEKAQNYCGDGVVGEHEECEISDSKPCENNSKLVTCSRYCTWNYSNCSDNCGDGIIQEEDGEECDGSELGGVTCEALGYSRGNPLCSNDCKFDTSTCEEAGSCGDGIFQSDWEECDSALPVECADLGYFTGTATCNEDCTVDDSACNHVYQWGCYAENYLYSNTFDYEGNFIVVGITNCGVDGFERIGDFDAYIVKFDRNGNKIWSRLLGTEQRELAYGVTTDPNGSIYIAGMTNGNLFSTNKGLFDAFYAKYTSDGTLLWGVQDGNENNNAFTSIQYNKDNDRIYMAGSTTGGFPGLEAVNGNDYIVFKLDRDGNVLNKILEGGTGWDTIHNIKVSQGNIWVTGLTTIDLFGEQCTGSYDIYITKYSENLEREWYKVFGTDQEDWAVDLDVDETGNIYLTGYTSGEFEGTTSSGGFDQFIMKLSPTGEILWYRKIGTSGNDGKFQLGNRIKYHQGNVYTVLNLDGQYEDNDFYGELDIVGFVFDTEGEIVDLRVIGTTQIDYAMGLNLDEEGYIYITGTSFGSYEGYSNAGQSDFVIIKY